MTDREELEIAVKALDSKKAKNITALKVDDLTILANYFVIASASSTTQVKALADEVEYQLGEKGVKPKGIEVCYLTGFSSMSWFAKCFTKQFGMRPKDFIRQNQDGKSSG